MKKNSFSTFIGRLAKRYPGKYVIVANNKIIAMGRSAMEAYKKAKSQLKPHRSFGVYYLPKPNDFLIALWISHTS